MGWVVPETFEFAARVNQKERKLKEICKIAVRNKSKAHCESKVIQ